MLDHIGFAVRDFGSHAGFGVGEKAFFWIGNAGIPANNVHIAFTGDARGAVDAFYKQR